MSTRFGPYRLDELLGRGGMGEVYRAYDTSKDRMVALKLLDGAFASDKVYRDRFRRESQAAARLGEPHVIPIHDWGEIDGTLFIDMRLVAGTDLRTMLRREHRLPPGRALHIVEQVGAALDAAHADGLVHRDVKPENILLGQNDFAYLVDFGIAHDAADSRLTGEGVTHGSVAYMAPELFDDVPVSPASDVYALASVFYECLTGQVPHPAASVSAAIKAAVTSPPPRPTRMNADLPAGLDAVIARGLAADPADRYVSSDDLVGAAREALEDTAAGRTEVIRAVGAAGASGAMSEHTPTVADDTLPDGDTGPSDGTPPEYAGGPQYGVERQYVSGPQYAGGPPYGGGPRYVAPGTGTGGYGPEGYGYASDHHDRTTMYVLAGLVAVIILVLAALAGWYFGLRPQNTAAAPATPTVTQTVDPGDNTTAPPATTTASLPSGAIQCGSQVWADENLTSCPFANAVGDAYLSSGPKGQARTVSAFSPVTATNYSMSCNPTDGYVTCRGGNNAIVYIL